MAKGLPSEIKKLCALYGIKPTVNAWLQFEEDCYLKKLPVTPVAANVEDMTDRQVKYFVKKHGSSNLAIYYFLNKALMRLDDPNDECIREEYKTKDIRNRAKCMEWKRAAYLITGMEDNEDLWQLLSWEYPELCR